VRSSPKENQSLEAKVKGISEMEFSLSIFDYTFTNYKKYKCQLIDLNLKLNNQARIAQYWRNKTTREYN